MSDRFFQELDLPRPDVELGVGSGPHGAQTAQMLIGIEKALAAHGPDAVLVYGDTNSTLAGALAAAKANVRIAHVEAGLRSFNRRMPEEINRVVTDQLSSLLLCPSDTAAANLQNEGITRGVHVIGDVMADVLAKFGNARHGDDVTKDLQLRNGEYFVATIHRAENTDDHRGLRSILAALGKLPLPVVLPAHPRLKAAMAAAGLAPHPAVRIIEPLGYASMMAVVRNARAVLTDSGGLQKEAYWLGVPCVTLREETEWVETVDAGWNTLAGADEARIHAAIDKQRPAAQPPLYGDGRAATRIIEAINSWN